MMAFQVNYGQCDSIIFPKTFSFTFLYLCLADIRILYIHQILESSQKIIIKLYVLQSLFVRGFNIKQRRGGIISIFTKGNQVLLGVISQFATFPFLHTPKKDFPSPSVWTRREYTWTLNWKESLLICFETCQNVPHSHE